MALVSLISILAELLFDKISVVSLFYNSTFGQGALAAIDTVRVWFGRDWILPDSWSPMLEALVRLQSGSDSQLYETLFFGARVKFQYAPTSLLPLEALATVLPLTPATLNALNALVLLAAAGATGRLAWLVFGSAEASSSARAGDAVEIDGRIMVVAAVCAFWIFYPVTRAFHLGQIQLWIDLAFNGACILWLTDRRTAAGAVIAAASMIKPQLGLLLLWALVSREWRFAQGFVLAALPIAMVSVARYGWENHVAYLDVLSHISRHGESYYANNSVNGLVNRLLFNGPNLTWEPNSFAPHNPYVYAATLVTGVFFVLLPLVLPLRRHKRATNAFDFGAAALCFTIAAPIAWEHHYGIMLPLFVIVLGSCLQRAAGESGRGRLVLLTASWGLSAGTYPAVHLLSGTVLNVLQSHLFFGALVLLFLLLDTAARVPDGIRSGQQSLDLEPSPS